MAEQPDESSSPCSSSDSCSHAEPRRGFLEKAAAIVLGGLVGLVPFAAGALCFLDPVLRSRGDKSGAGGFLRAANLSELPDDGSPQRFTLRSDVRDAWSLYRNRVIGSIYLRKIGSQVIAFNDTCTHLGCKVDFQASNKRFFCPCHQSSFDLDGKKQNPTPPRDLDVLDVKIEGEVVLVKYQNFRTATAEKKAI
jgi:menaquinol-cytochrome c reductase iron-sulfur subunit